MRVERAVLPAAAVFLGLTAVSLLFAGGNRAESPPAVAPSSPGGSSNLFLAPDLSFTDDSSANFPIRGENVSDGRIASDRPTVIFFGTAHCWNTNREAERFVALYRKHAREARFLVVDLQHASADQQKLVARFYRGYIPTLAFLDRNGNVVYNRAGETARERGDASALEGILKKAIGE
jgi:hypothetical protein